MRSKTIKPVAERRKPVLIDVMKNDRFYRQIQYAEKGDWKIIDGEIKEVYDFEKIKSFVESKIPSLQNKNYQICFTDQKIFL